MVNINITNEEITALDAVLKKIKTDVKTGFMLSSLRIKIQQALNRELEQIKKKKAREILGIKDEKKKNP